MKNVHLIETDKPSRLIIYSTLLNEFRLLDEPIKDWKHKRHIYITDNSEIKEGDWCFDGTDLIHKKTKYNDALVDGNKDAKKIILTTDQDLIADGIQAIDDEFLEWFVKNPSCEFVEVEREKSIGYAGDRQRTFYGKYKITIPKKEPKPHSFCETPEVKCTMNYCDENGCQNRNRELLETKEEPKKDVNWKSDIINKIWDEDEETKRETEHLLSTETNKKRLLEDVSKQETLEEVARTKFPHKLFVKVDITNKKREAFIEGYKLAQEQEKNKYSEEEVLKAFDAGLDYMKYGNLNKKEWFEQYKK